MKKIGKTTNSFRYDLNQIPYDYTVEVASRFKGLDLIDRVPDELWTEVRDIVQETGSKTIPKKNKCNKAKWLSEEALQISVKRIKTKCKGEKERYTHVNAAFQRTARKDKKDFLNDQEASLDFSNCPFSVWVDLVIESILLKLFVSTLINEIASNFFFPPELLKCVSRLY